MTITQSSWKTQPGDLAVMIKPLRPFIAKPRLSLISASEDRDFAFAACGEVLTAIVPEADVARLMAAPADGSGLHLLLAMRALFKPGTPTRRWQWGVKLAQEGKALTCYGPRGISVPPDADGFVRSAVHAFPAHRLHGHDAWDLVLAERTAQPGAAWHPADRTSSPAGDSELCRAR